MKPAITDNQALRVLFALPPIKLATSTALSLPELPPRNAVTGDEEIDAVLWLREVIGTGEPAMIEKAMQAAKLVTTPLDVLEKRYTRRLMEANPGNFAVALSTFGFADLDGLAARAISKRRRCDEAMARFGSIDALFERTPAEQACEKALKGMRQRQPYFDFDEAKARARFEAHPELRPHTLADCLHVIEHGNTLYWLRQAASNDAGDHWPAFQAHLDFCFAQLARSAPRSNGEALAVLEHLLAEEAMGRAETSAILRNLIAGCSPAAREVA